MKPEYQNALLGWSDYVDIDCELPDKDMPEGYYGRNTNIPR